MGRWITFGPESKPLEIFSMQHIAVMAVILTVCVTFAFICRRLKSAELKNKIGYAFAAFMFLQQSSIYLWYIFTGKWSVTYTLPLQLCDLSGILSFLALITKKRYLMELLYFWGLGGATQAILTPDVGFSFPHFIFYQFFMSHTLVIMAVLYIVIAFDYKPTIRSVIRVFVITNIYALIIFPLNFILKSNYLFLRIKPSGGSILNFLGPWPWYILSLEVVTAVIFMLLYLSGRGCQGDGSRDNL